MSDFLNLARPSEELLTTIINQTNGVDLTNSQLVFSDPTESVDAVKNTTLVVSGNGVDYVGSTEVNYDRLDLGSFLMQS